MIAREPVLNPIAIAELRPTQITVGFREVAEKRREWRDRAEKSAKKAAHTSAATWSRPCSARAGATT